MLAISYHMMNLSTLLEKNGGYNMSINVSVPGTEAGMHHHNWLDVNIQSGCEAQMCSPVASPIPEPLPGLHQLEPGVITTCFPDQAVSLIASHATSDLTHLRLDCQKPQLQPSQVK